MKTNTKRIAAALIAVLSAAAFAGQPVAMAKTAAVSTAAVLDGTVYPEAVSGSYTKNGAVIKWKKAVNGKKYLIYRSVDGSSFKSLGATTKLTYTDKTVKKGHKYSYKIIAEARAAHKTYHSAPSEVIEIDISKSGNAAIRIYDDPIDYGTPEKLYGTDELEGYSEEEEYYEEEEYEDDYDYDDYEVCEEEPAEYDTAAGEALETVAAVPAPDEKDERPAYYYAGDDTITAGTLTAGQLNDEKDYKKFIRYVDGLNGNNYSDSEYLYSWVDVHDRFTVTVTNGKEKLAGAKAELLDKDGKVVFSAVTDNKGVAYLFPGMAASDAEKVRVTSADGAQKYEKELSRLKTNSLLVTLGKTANTPKKLDLMFMVDTTGSMSDELKYLQVEIDDVIGRISANNGDLPIRTSVNFYRDTGDKYVVRSFRFRTNVDVVKSSLADQKAYGGGDFPEAVHTALDVALNKHAWCEDSTKIMFLVLDAPPHSEVSEDYVRAVKEAAEQGIRIIPVASSGIDEGTEYILRSSAVLTGGRYVFLTDDSGVGLSHKKPSTDSYAVNKLNDILVNIVGEYLE